MNRQQRLFSREMIRQVNQNMIDRNLDDGLSDLKNSISPAAERKSSPPDVAATGR